MSKYYGGIGSRKTPPDKIAEMRSLGFLLSKDGYVLLSGGAMGADSAFENGCDDANGDKLIFKPDYWYGRLNGKTYRYIKYKKEHVASATLVASNHHPAWERLTPFVKKLMVRNVFIVMGGGLETKVDFLACWTPDGSVGKTTMATGGTGHSIRVAKSKGMKVYNLKREDALGGALGLY